MRDRFTEIAARGAAVLVVSFSPVAALERYRAQLELPFPVAADVDRSAYRAYRLGAGSFWSVWHPRVLWRYVVLTRRGMKLQRPAGGDDLSQLGGDFVIDGDGIVRFAHPSRRPDDRPAVQALLDALDGETTTR